MAILCKKNFYCKNFLSTPRKSNSFHPLKKSWRPPFLSPGCMGEKNVAKYFRDTRSGWRWWWPAVAGVWAETWLARHGPVLGATGGGPDVPGLGPLQSPARHRAASTQSAVITLQIVSCFAKQRTVWLVTAVSSSGENNESEVEKFWWEKRRALTSMWNILVNMASFMAKTHYLPRNVKDNDDKLNRRSAIQRCTNGVNLNLLYSTMITVYF